MLQSLSLDPSRQPCHVAIIMDGNGRWAEKRMLPRLIGHKAGVESVRAIVEECRRLNIKYITLYAFSTENWKRPEDEVSGLMQLLSLFLDSELKNMKKNGVSLSSIGDRNRLPEAVRQRLEDAIHKTAEGKDLVLNLALNYGGRNEIVRAAASVARRCVAGDLDADQIDEAFFAAQLDTAGMPDPDLLIRTGGESRLSNFLLWQTSYAELYFSSVYWPDFRVAEFHRALKEYQKRQRRFGETGSQTNTVISTGCQAG